MPLAQKLAIMGEFLTEQATAALGDDPRNQVVKAGLGLVGTA